MAEFCLDCWNKLNETSLTEKDITIFKDLCLCEGCGKMKNVIDFYERNGLLKRLIKRIIRR